MSTLTIEIDGEFVALRGTTKGDTAQRAAITRPWVWGGRAGAWVLPRNLRPETRALAIRTVTAALSAAGFEVDVEDGGERQTEAERREASAERLAARADRYDAGAVRAAAERDAALTAKRTLMDGIPFGQPILVGHHSERRARKDAARIHTLMGKAIDADTKASDLARKAEGIRHDLAGTPLVTLRNRIAKNEAEIRRLRHLLDDGPTEGEWRGRVEEILRLAEEALDLDRAELQRRRDAGVVVYGPEDFKPGDLIFSWGGWREVVRVNKVTLSCTSGYSWLDKIRYQDVRDHRPLNAAEIAATETTEES